MILLSDHMLTNLQKNRLLKQETKTWKTENRNDIRSSSWEMIKDFNDFWMQEKMMKNWIQQQAIEQEIC